MGKGLNKSVEALIKETKKSSLSMNTKIMLGTAILSIGILYMHSKK